MLLKHALVLPILRQRQGARWKVALMKGKAKGHRANIDRTSPMGVHSLNVRRTRLCAYARPPRKTIASSLHCHPITASPLGQSHSCTQIASLFCLMTCAKANNAHDLIVCLFTDSHGGKRRRRMEELVCLRHAWPPQQPRISLDLGASSLA